MGAVYRKSFTKPLPADAEIITRKGERLARWRDGKGKRLGLMRRRAAGDSCHGGYDGDVFNEVLLPFLEMIPADRVAALAVETAEEVDAFLLAVPDEVVEAALARPDRPNLDRGMHREYHLDRIERALAEAG